MARRTPRLIAAVSLLLAATVFIGGGAPVFAQAKTKTPSLRITAPREGQTLTASQVQIKVSAKNAPKGSQFRYAVDKAPVATTTKSKITITALAEGEHAVAVEMLDRSGSLLDPPIRASVTFLFKVPAKQGKVAKDAIPVPVQEPPQEVVIPESAKELDRASNFGVRPIRAVFNGDAQSTTYTAHVIFNRSGGEKTVKWTWGTVSCGSQGTRAGGGTFRPSQELLYIPAVMGWHHPHPPCDRSTDHSGEIITLTVTDGVFEVGCRYQGAASGEGGECVEGFK